GAARAHHWPANVGCPVHAAGLVVLDCDRAARRKVFNYQIVRDVAVNELDCRRTACSLLLYVLVAGNQPANRDVLLQADNIALYVNVPSNQPPGKVLYAYGGARWAGAAQAAVHDMLRSVRVE